MGALPSGPCIPVVSGAQHRLGRKNGWIVMPNSCEGHSRSAENVIYVSSTQVFLPHEHIFCCIQNRDRPRVLRIIVPCLDPARARRWFNSTTAGLRCSLVNMDHT